MSVSWRAIGQRKLRPEPRIARFSLVLVHMLACASLILGTTEGRPVPRVGAQGLLQAKAACGSKRRPPMHYAELPHAKTDTKQSQVLALQPAEAPAKPFNRPSL